MLSGTSELPTAAPASAWAGAEALEDADPELPFVAAAAPAPAWAGAAELEAAAELLFVARVAPAAAGGAGGVDAAAPPEPFLQCGRKICSSEVK